ncbi:MAG TPA: hypothetical protein VJT08_01270 [Terriglobales bacterium]|nr:hypothetical protein [Terriglobales bacterium]
MIELRIEKFPSSVGVSYTAPDEQPSDKRRYTSFGSDSGRKLFVNRFDNPAQKRSS